MDPTREQSSREHLQSVLHQLSTEGVEGRDSKRYFGGTYHADVQIYEAPSLPTAACTGVSTAPPATRAAFLETWDHLQSGDARLLRPEIHPFPDLAFVTWAMTTIDPTSGETRSLPAISRYAFKDGLIVDARMHHLDTAALLSWLDPWTSTSP